MPASELSSPAVRRTSRGRRAAVALAALALAGAGGLGVATSAGAATARPGASSSSTVAAMQRALGVPADGVMGPITRRAVKRFQRRHHLTVDGIIGPQTLAALKLRRRAASNRTFETASARTGGGDTLQRIARCESGGDPRAISADGRYRGKYQFTRETWRAMGGTGDPAKAPEFVQDQMAARLLASRGTAPWPACSARL